MTHQCEVYAGGGRCPETAERQVKAGYVVGKLWLCPQHAAEHAGHHYPIIF